MPVPKKRQSKSKTNSRRFTWKEKASKQFSKALSKARFAVKKKMKKRINEVESETNLSENS